ncbi:MAG: hypothetical protein K2H47_03425 [Muribaculaceae bacterium]|nr:hypothetical protein [Muribaculaceae bacterium]
MTKNNLSALGPFVMSLIDSAIRAVTARMSDSRQPVCGVSKLREVTVEIDLGLLRSDIVEATGYAAVKSGRENSDFDRVAICENDFPLLDSYRREAQRTLSVHLCRYLPMWSETNDTLRLRLSVPADFSKAFIAPLTDGVHAYLLQSMLSRWCALISDTAGTEAAVSRAEQAVSDIIGMLAYRLRPVTRRMPPI